MTMGAGFLPKPTDNWPTWLVVVYYIVVGLIGLGFVAVMIIKTFKFLKKGQAGIRVRRGQPVIKDGEFAYVGPGIHPMIPFVDSIEEINVQEQIAEMKPVLVERDRCQSIIDASPTWRVTNTPQGVHDALFVPRGLESSVVAIMRVALNRAYETTPTPQDKSAVGELACQLAASDLSKNGVELIRPGIASITRVPVQVLGDLLGSGAEASDVAKGAAAATAFELLEGGRA